jgi:hypothetical protein
MTDLQKEMKEFLDETVEYYSANPEGRRCTSMIGCHYSPQTARKFGSEGCAIGRKMTPLNAIKADRLYTGGVKTLLREFPDLLPENLRRMPENFLVSVQNLHDSPMYWTSTGLSVFGKELVAQIRETYINASN